MKLTPEAIELIRKRRDLKEKLCTEMGWTLSNLYSQLAANKDDSTLTKLTAASIISTNLNKPITELYQ